MVHTPIYMDNHATTRVDPRVLEAMLPYFSEKYGNAASVNHSFGWEAADAVEAARAQVARLLNVSPKGIIFTSGATEANNLALKGILHAASHLAMRPFQNREGEAPAEPQPNVEDSLRESPRDSRSESPTMKTARWEPRPPRHVASEAASVHLVTAAAEHRSVLDPANRLKRAGCEVTIVPVDQHGRVDPQAVAEAVRPETTLVSIMAANNEVGTINDIAAVGAICRERGVLFHTDAVQALGRIPLDLSKLPVDLAGFSAHKLYGPKGVGALYVRHCQPRIPIEPLFDGGGHERHLRSGTLAVPLIVGFGKACELARESLADEADSIRRLRDRLWDGLRSELDGVHLNGHPEHRLPGNLNVSFEGVDGEALMMSLKDIAVSSGSACTTADPEPSHVLRAMGRSDALTRASLRFGLGRFNTADEVDRAVAIVAEAVRRLRNFG